MYEVRRQLVAEECFKRGMSYSALAREMKLTQANMSLKTRGKRSFSLADLKKMVVIFGWDAYTTQKFVLDI